MDPRNHILTSYITEHQRQVLQTVDEAREDTALKGAEPRRHRRRAALIHKSGVSPQVVFQIGSVNQQQALVVSKPWEDGIAGNNGPDLWKKTETTSLNTGQPQQFHRGKLRRRLSEKLAGFLLDGDGGLVAEGMSPKPVELRVSGYHNSRNIGPARNQHALTDP
jgi:hypothetical protein|tara:strand:- start:8215 stop:8706 length:492 start_codon:yes stop_codon:yes gene_type:complete